MPQQAKNDHENELTVCSQELIQELYDELIELEKRIVLAYLNDREVSAWLGLTTIKCD